MILAMFNAVRLVFRNLTDYECDAIDFMAILTHLILQEVQKGGIELGEETTIGKEET